MDGNLVLKQEAAPTISEGAQGVWDNSGSIHAHFGDDVAEFERRTQAQNNSSPSIRHHFDGLDSDKLGYRRIYPSYFALGITNPAHWIRENIRYVSFLGKNVSIHKDLEATLATIEGKIRGDPNLANLGTSAGIVKVGGFVPRRIKGSTSLSHHSVGKAVDLNSATNIRFLDLGSYKAAGVRILLKIIMEVTGVDLDTVDEYTTQIAASDDFKSGFGTWLENQNTWLNDFLKLDVVRINTLLAEKRTELRSHRRDPVRRAEIKAEMQELKGELISAKDLVKVQKKWLKDVKKVQGATSKLETTGFLDLNEHIVKHVQDAGLERGGEWSEAKKDFMHFQSGSVSS